jgi:hypothetical protein
MKYDLTDVDITDYFEVLAKIEKEGREYELYELEELVRELATILNLKPHRVNEDIMFAKLHGDKFQNLYDEAMDNDLRLLKSGGKSKIWLQKKRNKKSVTSKSKRKPVKKCKCK